MAIYKTADLFGVPDELSPPKEGLEKKTHRKSTSLKSAPETKQKKKVRQAQVTPTAPVVNLPGQGFLPGLSRRGRPRLAKPISAVERTAEHRRKRIANGAKRVEIILDSDVSRALDRLAEHHQEPRSDVIATLIRKAASRLKV